MAGPDAVIMPPAWSSSSDCRPLAAVRPSRRPDGAGSLGPWRKRFVIIGGGPAGNKAATHAARLGAEVTLVERDIVGGAAHLWDCIPSKAMIATGGALSLISAAPRAWASPTVDADARLRRAARAASAASRTSSSARSRGLLESQGVRMLQGTGRARRARTRSWSRPPTASIELEADVVAAVAPAAGPASPTGRRSTASGSSPPATPTRRPSCPSTSS